MKIRKMRLKTTRMELKLNRIFKGSEYTIGKLMVNDAWFCDVLEDTVREIGPNGEGKVPGETAIPAGTYEIILNMSPRFKRILPRILDVPHFSGVLIHSGNHKDHTDGCLLPGLNTQKGMVTQSRVYTERLIALMQEAVDNGEKITIEII
jgi:hypothetical protein